MRQWLIWDEKLTKVTFYADREHPLPTDLKTSHSWSTTPSQRLRNSAGDIVEGWWQGLCVWLILLVGSVCTVHGECVYYYPRLNSSSPAGVRISWCLVQCATNIPAYILYVLHLKPQPALSQLSCSRQNIRLVLFLSFAPKFDSLESSRWRWISLLMENCSSLRLKILHSH